MCLCVSVSVCICFCICISVSVCACVRVSKCTCMRTWKCLWHSTMVSCYLLRLFYFFEKFQHLIMRRGEERRGEERRRERTRRERTRREKKQEKRGDKMKRRWKGEWKRKCREIGGEKCVFWKCLRTPKSARWIGIRQTCFDKKIPFGRIIPPFFLRKFRICPCFQFTYMIRIRLFGTVELNQKGFSAARYSATACELCSSFCISLYIDMKMILSLKCLGLFL